MAEFGAEWDNRFRRAYEKGIHSPHGESLRWYQAITERGSVPKAHSVARAIAGICDGQMTARTTWRRIAALGTGGRNDAAKLSLDALAKAGLLRYKSMGRGRGAYTEIHLIQPKYEPVKRGGARQWPFKIVASEYDRNYTAA